MEVIIFEKEAYYKLIGELKNIFKEVLNEERNKKIENDWISLKEVTKQYFMFLCLNNNIFILIPSNKFDILESNFLHFPFYYYNNGLFAG